MTKTKGLPGYAVLGPVFLAIAVLATVVYRASVSTTSSETKPATTVRVPPTPASVASSAPAMHQAVLPPPTPPEKLGPAMDKDAVRNMVRQLRVAMAQRDDVTTRAGMAALRRHPAEARDVIVDEMQNTSDSAAVAILNDMLYSIK